VIHIPPLSGGNTEKNHVCITGSGQQRKNPKQDMTTPLGDGFKIPDEYNFMWFHTFNYALIQFR